MHEAPVLTMPVQLLHKPSRDEMKPLIRRGPIQFANVLMAKAIYGQKHGKAILAVSSMLDGVFGSKESLHVAAWRTIKVTDRSEEVEPDGTIIQRERERFTNELTLVFASGKTAILH